MPKFIIIVLALLLSGFCPQETGRSDSYVMKAAEGQLDVFLDKIEVGQAPAYGFTNEDDMDLCTVGKPYRIIEFNKSFFDSKQLAENTDYIAIKNEWRVPVMIKGQYRNVLTVSGNSGNYSVTAMGDPELARGLQQKSSGVSENDQFYILRIYPLLAEFFAHEGDNSFIDARFIPLASAIAAIPALSKTKKPYFTLAEVQQLVKEAVIKNAASTSPVQKKTSQPKKKAAKKQL